MPETRGLPLYFLLLPRTLPTPPSPSFTVFPLPPHYFPSTTTVNTSTKFLLSLSSHYSHYFLLSLHHPTFQLFSLHHHFYRHHYQRHQISIVLITYLYCFPSTTTPPSHYYCSFSSPPPQFHYFPSTTHLPTSKPFQ